MGETTSVDIKQNKRLWTWPNLAFRRGWRKYYRDPLERPDPNWAVYPKTAFDNERSQTLHDPNAMILAISGRKHGPKLKNNKVFNENARFQKQRGLGLGANTANIYTTQTIDTTQIKNVILKLHTVKNDQKFHAS